MNFQQYFRRRASHLKQQLQSLLEKKESLDSGPQESFAIQTELSGIEDLRFGLPLSYPKKIESIFTKLSPFFEGGVLFKSNQSSWSPLRSFYEGQLQSVNSTDKKLKFDFPVLNLTEIKKASNQKVLQDLGIDLGDKSIDAFLLKPHPEYLILVLCSLPDPWRKIHVEKIQTQLLMAVSDIL